MFPAILGSRLHCPYCYRPFRQKEIRFRCSGRTGKRAKCATALDRTLADQLGDRTPQLPVFDADSRKSTAVHPPCGAETHYRVCPHCHSQLPVHFGQSDSKMIALVGAKNSGKTIYMTVLLHELMNNVGERFSAAVLGADEETRKKFQLDYEQRLYQDHELFGTTKTLGAQRGGRRPLVFSFTTPDGGRKVRRSLLSFFDTAGEDMVSEHSVDQNVRYLTSADGIILLFDPLQLREARIHADADALLPEIADSPATVLTNIVEQLHGRLGVKANRRIGTPLAVVFTKMDALEGYLPPESPLRRVPPSTASFNESDSLAVHRHMRALLDDWAGHNLDEALSANFAKYRMFGVTALGESPRLEGGTRQRVSERGVQPRRVEDPFLWLMSEFGAVPKSTKPAGE
ncbi:MULTISPECIES: TRAFAC clade GTPase domain-containing protein [Saccharothrix]|uniref:TRAFAC clade GTPase domain-containing protein n=1 Tax=Saccharothrix TaxID=2071 RepID=UPI0009F8FBC1|nr:GTPase domain-containing protein [Saccharothrix sp. CB00851]